MSNIHLPEYDLAIAGGGLVGASLAAAMAPTGAKILVIETHPLKSENQPSFDERTVALTWSSRQIYQAMGIWNEIAHLGAEPIDNIHITNKGHTGQTHLSCKHVGTEALGYVVPTRVLGKVLWEKIREYDNVKFICPGTVSKLQSSSDFCRFEIDGFDKPAITSSFFVIADGGRSGLVEQAGFNRCQQDYFQSAILSIVTTDRPHNGRAYERFTPEGPIALLPHSLLDGYYRYATVWTCSDDETEDRLALDDTEFICALQTMFGDRAGLLSNPSERKSYPLKRSIVDSVAANRTFVIGNSAHSVHPVAGQGFNLGLRDVATLTECLIDSQQNQDTADSITKGYIRKRECDTTFVNQFTHSLLTIFESNRPVTRATRNLGLNLIEHFPPAKRFLLRRTMGLSGKQSRMAMGISASSS